MPTEKKRKGKINPTILVAIIGLVGTLITAILTSPVLIALIQKESTATPVVVTATTISDNTPTTPPETPVDKTQILVFSNTFENGNTSGFVFKGGDWKLGKDKNRPVLEGAGPTQNGQISSADFGPLDFSDGIIEFQLKFMSRGGFLLNYRGMNNEVYTLYLDPVGQEVILGYNNDSTNWNPEPFKPNGSRSFAFDLDTWYLVHLEANGGQFTLWIDNNLILTDSDARLSTGSLSFVLLNDADVFLDEVKVWELK